MAGKAASATLMTDGPIWKRMIAFAVPLFWGNLFQQLYNTADSVIVGNFLGNNALAAVSSSGNLIFLMVGFFNGIAIGAGVVTGKYFGERESEKIHPYNNHFWLDVRCHPDDCRSAGSAPHSGAHGNAG